jgi:NAD(P)-dependent dehydrogenase (short-subunit alcohol dehydrogenase family)
MTDQHDPKVALVVGAGDATGGAVARRFAREGYITCVTRRNEDKLEPLLTAITSEGGTAHGYGSDARDEQAVAELVADIERHQGPIDVAVYNIGANVNFPIVETTSRVYYKVWEMACFGAFLMGREVAKRMIPRGRGTIIFTGATASVMGRTGFSAFASAKFAKRGLAQSMARELGPKGIHVAHVNIDGPIDTAFIRENMQDMLAQRDYQDNMLQPDDIAEVYWNLHTQPRSTWTFEMDLRPWAEPW